MSAAAALARLVPGAGTDRRAVARLSAGHVGADLFLGTVPALMPFFVSERGLSYADAGLLVLAGSLASSITQPAAGLLGDRLRAPWLPPLGLALTGAGLLAATLVHSFTATMAALLAGGFGVAIFHPEAVRAMRDAAGSNPGAALGIFAVGGTVGFALGPALAVPLGAAFGLSVVGAVALLPLVMALWLALARGQAAAVAAPARPAEPARHAPSDRRAFGCAAAAATCLAAFIFTMIAFVPSWFADDLGSSLRTGGLAVAAMLVAGAAGTYVGGRLTDTHGRRMVIVGSLALLLPLAALLPLAPLALALPLLVLLGLVMDASFFPLVVTAQDALPGRDGLAAGVVLGLSIGLGAGVTSLLGHLADTHGPRAPLVACIGLAALAVALAALSVPRPRRATESALRSNPAPSS